MRKRALRYVKHPFFAGSMVMIVGSNIYNAGQFFYHMLAGRLLGKVLYGDFSTIISLMGIIGVVQLSLNLAIVRHISKLEGKKDIGNFLKWIEYWSLKIGITLTIIFLLMTPVFDSFLNISDKRALFLLPPLVLVFVFVNIYRSILQGLMKFDRIVFALISESVVKIGLSLLFIYIGLSLFGTVLGFLIGVIVAVFVARLPLKNYLSAKRGKRPKIAGLLKFSVPVLVQGLALTSMYSTDLFLVKHYLSAQTAGIYASLAILGRVVFFGTSPITQVMFPIVSKRHAQGKSHTQILLLSMLMVAGFAGGITVIYYLFPKLAINILYGREYLEGAAYLWLFAIFMGLLAIASNLTQFYLSVGKTNIVFVFVAAAVLQAVGILHYHSDILSVIKVSIASTTLLVVVLLVYFVYYSQNVKVKEKK